MRAEEVGDEPLWLATELPAVQVWVGRNRRISAQKAIDQGATVLILDDGFQHRRLHRDFDVVCLAEQQDAHLLPYGRLRDLPSRLSLADLLISVGGKAPVVFQRSSPVALQGKKVALFCAIANPDRFVRDVKALGGEIVATLFKPDHEPFSLEEIETLARHSQAECLVCTEKDAIKLSSLQTSIPLVPIPLELSIQTGHDAWKQFIEEVFRVRRISSHSS